MLVVSLLAIAWLMRDRAQAEKERREELQAAFAAHLATAQQVIPLATKLADCVEVLERVTDRAIRGAQG
jgi:hypothetical protein